MSLLNFINVETFKIASITKYRTENITELQIKEIITKEQFDFLNTSEPETKIFFSKETCEYVFYYFVENLKLYAVGIDEDRNELLIPFQE